MCTQLQQFYNEFKSEYSHKYPFQEKINHIDDCVYMFPFTSSFNDQTILMFLSVSGNTTFVKRCLELGADINKFCGNGSSALSLAMYSEEYETAEILLKAGANPNTKIGVVPILFLFFWKIKIEGVQLLLRYGAMTNEIHKFKHHCKGFHHSKRKIDYFNSLIAKRRWVIVKCLVLTLSLHKRAVERVNHPDRLKLLGVFKV